MNEYDLNLLAIFEALMKTRSVSKASELLQISQPSMSNALARLRESFGDPMFVRVKNEMEPTARALEIAVPVAQVLEMARSEIFVPHSFQPDDCCRMFTLCMTDVAEAAYLPAITAKFRHAAPHASLKTVSPVVERVEEGLESGAVELGIGFFPDIKSAGILQQQLLRSGGFMLIADIGNPYLETGDLTLSTFVRAPHVAVKTEGRSHEVIERAMADKELRRKVVLCVPHYLGLMSIIPRSDLIAVIPADLAATFRRQEGLEVYPLPFSGPTVGISQLWHQRNNKNAANKWLRDLVRNSLQDHRAGSRP